MRMREALAGLINSLGWETESDTTTGMVSQLSRMIEVTDGQITVKEQPEYACKLGNVGYESVDEAIADANGRTVKLMADLDQTVAIPAGVTATLHLNGHSIVTEQVAITNSGKLTVRGGNVESTKSFAIVSNSGAVTRVERCTVKSVEGAVITGKAKGTTVVITGCDMYASDNAVVAGNGSRGFGGNSVTIRDSKLHGAIVTDGYIACGIYCPTDDTFDVKNCVVDVTGGCGVLSRAGTVNLMGTTIATTGTAEGMVGDAQAKAPCAALVFDEESDYPSLSDGDGIHAYTCRITSEAGASHVIGEGDRIEVI